MHTWQMNRCAETFTDADGRRSVPWNGHRTGAHARPDDGSSPP